MKIFYDLKELLMQLKYSLIRLFVSRQESFARINVEL